MFRTIIATVVLCVTATSFAAAAERIRPLNFLTEDAFIGTRIREALLADMHGEMALSPNERQGVQRFYASRSYEPVWVTKDGLTAKAKLVLAEIVRADDWGLVASRYRLPAATPAGPLSPDQRATLEAEFVRAVLRYATDAHVGQFEPTVISDLIDRGSTAPDAFETLRNLATTDAPDKVLLAYHPQHPQFEKLRQKYLELTRSTAPVDAPIIIPEGPKLKPGASHEHVALLRKRLKVEAAAGSDPTIYDEALVAAVKEFQTEHGLRRDGTMGRSLRTALNGQVKGNDRSAQAKRVLANMERLRWLPEDMGAVHVWDNIPEFTTRAIDNGKVIFEERIIVGRPSTPTPVFSDQFEYVEFHPYWNVPASIKVNELLPQIQRGGGGALARQGLQARYKGRVVNPSAIDWGGVDIRNIEIFQPPGRGNALGTVKFMFPNRHDVYMHDTPNKGLFNESMRAFSHGCMRLRNPHTFADVLLDLGNGMSPAEVKKHFAGSDNHQVPLTNKIPVHVTYFTAWVADDGTLSFKNDVYGHDKRTTLALEGKFDQIQRQTGTKANLEILARGSTYSDVDFPTIFDLSTNSTRPSRKSNSRSKQ